MDKEIQTKRLDWIRDLLPEDSCIWENGYEQPLEPGRYLAIEYSDDEPVWAYGNDTLKGLAELIDQSETSSTRTDVWDLDERKMLKPITRTVGFFHHGEPVERIDVLTVKPVDPNNPNSIWPLPGWVPSGNDQKYIDWAKENLADDELEIDDEPAVSKGDDPGAWVAAWVWVSNEDAGISVEEEGEADGN